MHRHLPFLLILVTCIACDEEATETTTNATNTSAQNTSTTQASSSNSTTTQTSTSSTSTTSSTSSQATNTTQTETTTMTSTNECVAQVSVELPNEPGATLQVRAVDDCANLSQPLVAMNWFSVKDAKALAEYDKAAGPLILGSGARILATAQTTEHILTPKGSTPSGGPWEHSNFVAPMYPSAQAFLSIVTSPQFSNAPPKEDGVQNHYEFGFQECLKNCDPKGPILPTIQGPYLVQHLKISKDAVDAWLKEAPDVVYAGYRIAEFVVVSPSGKTTPPTPWQESPWADATIVYSVADKAKAQELIDSDNFKLFSDKATTQSLHLMDVGK